MVLYFNYAFVHRLNGADARVIGLIEFLLECGCNLIVYSYSNHVDCPWGPEEVELFRARYPNVELVLDRRPAVFDVWKRAKKLLSMLFPAATKTLVRARLPGVMPNYTRLNAQVPNAVWFVSYANGLVELNGVTSWTTIIETHDMDFLIFHKIFGHSLTSFRIIGRWRSEFALLGLASAMIAIAAPEAGLFRLCFPEKPVFFIPDYSSARLLEAPIEPRLMDCDVVFVGSDNTFNVDGLCAFIYDYRDFLSKYTLAVAGNVCKSERVRQAAQSTPNVRLLGYVDDTSDLYSRCRVAISPIDGTGLKIKVIEALAAGKPVFGSRHTIAGLPLGYQHCVFPVEVY